MSDTMSNARILSVDDDPDIRDLISACLADRGMDVATASNATEALDSVAHRRPDLILMDVMMPDTDGYSLCRRLLADADLCSVPVIFITALDSEKDKLKAFAAGGVDHVVKPFRCSDLVALVEKHLRTTVRFSAINDAQKDWTERLVPEEFVRFKSFILDRVPDPDALAARIEALRPMDLYGNTTGIATSEDLAGMIAEFLEVERIRAIAPDAIDLGVLPTAFCRNNLVVPASSADGPLLIVSNPFNWELMDTIGRFTGGRDFQLQIAEPRVILQILSGATEESQQAVTDASAGPAAARVHSFGDAAEPLGVDAIKQAKPQAESMADNSPVTFIANNIIISAATQRASDVHIEPKESSTVVRFRIDGDMRDFVTLKRATGSMLISRFKALAGLDIAEKRKPQDGSMEAVVQERRFKLRLATTSTPQGESLIMRLLEAEAKPKRLSELGMTPAQEAIMECFADRSHGLICIVGPTGSGKTTTIYSLISQIDADKRSILSIEDPVEYRIPKANQQQVNEKAGVTFESLLRSVVRQDPDVMFLGEIRDPYSAKMSMDFASTGHLTITSLHTTNATTALFRFERLGISRDVMAEAMLAVVAQRLIKRLCPECREVVPISDEERAWLEPFTDDIPEMVAHPKGCPSCGNTGYSGREAVNEILEFDPQVQNLVREEAPVPAIREFCRRRGDYMMYDHAISKVRSLTFSPKDVREKVLVEEAILSPDDAGADEGFYDTALEVPSGEEVPARPAAAVGAPAPARSRSAAAFEPSAPARAAGPGCEFSMTPQVLVVDDDPDIRVLLETILKRGGYEVVTAADGGDALLALGRNCFDAVIADLVMPGLTGFKMLEIMRAQGTDAPVIFLTASDTEADEAAGLALGAADYMHKPVRAEVLLARIKRAMATTQGA